MTNQRDPNSTRDRIRSQMRRDDGSWGMVPILLVLVAILGLGYYAFNRMNDPVNPRSTTTENARPGATTPPATTPTPTTPKQP